MINKTTMYSVIAALLVIGGAGIAISMLPKSGITEAAKKVVDTAKLK